MAHLGFLVGIVTLHICTQFYNPSWLEGDCFNASRGCYEEIRQHLLNIGRTIIFRAWININHVQFDAAPMIYVEPNIWPCHEIRLHHSATPSFENTQYWIPCYKNLFTVTGHSLIG